MRKSALFRWKKAHQQLAAVSVAALLMLSLFSIMLIPTQGDGVTGFATTVSKEYLGGSQGVGMFNWRITCSDGSTYTTNDQNVCGSVTGVNTQNQEVNLRNGEMVAFTTPTTGSPAATSSGSSQAPNQVGQNGAGSLVINRQYPPLWGFIPQSAEKTVEFTLKDGKIIEYSYFDVTKKIKVNPSDPSGANSLKRYLEYYGYTFNGQNANPDFTDPAKLEGILNTANKPSVLGTDSKLTTTITINNQNNEPVKVAAASQSQSATQVQAQTGTSQQPATFTGETSNGIGKRDYSVAVEMTNGVVTKLTVTENCGLACALFDGASAGKVKGTYDSITDFVRDCGATCGEMKVMDGNGASKTINELINSPTAPVETIVASTSGSDAASDAGKNQVGSATSGRGLCSIDSNSGIETCLSTSNVNPSSQDESKRMMSAIEGVEADGPTYAQTENVQVAALPLVPLAALLGGTGTAAGSAATATGTISGILATIASASAAGIAINAAVPPNQGGSTQGGFSSTKTLTLSEAAVLKQQSSSYSNPEGRTVYVLNPNTIIYQDPSSKDWMSTTSVGAAQSLPNLLQQLNFKPVDFGSGQPPQNVGAITETGFGSSGSAAAESNTGAQTKTADKVVAAPKKAVAAPLPENLKDIDSPPAIDKANFGDAQTTHTVFTALSNNAKVNGATYKQMAYESNKLYDAHYIFAKEKAATPTSKEREVIYWVGPNQKGEVRVFYWDTQKKEWASSEDFPGPDGPTNLVNAVLNPGDPDYKGAMGTVITAYSGEKTGLQKIIAPASESDKAPAAAPPAKPQNANRPAPPEYEKVETLSPGIDLIRDKGSNALYIDFGSGSELVKIIPDQESPKMFSGTYLGEDGKTYTTVVDLNQNKLSFYDGDLKKISETSLGNKVDSASGTTPDSKNQPPSNWFASYRTFQREYAQYQGVAGFSSLFFPQEFLAEWRNNIESVFAQTYLGTQYWSSELCSQYVDGKNEGFVFANTPQGLSELAAFVKATRTPAAIDENRSTSYIYFIEVRVKNGNSEKDLNLLETLRFNVELRGTKTAQLFSEKKSVGRGKEFKKLGKGAIAQDSITRYDTICLVMDEVPYRWRISGKEICSPIPDNTGTPTSVVPVSVSGGASAPALPEVNDI